MSSRSYRHYCGVAQALDLVGERWALLVVRELLRGPKRYSDLLAGLPGISTNVLAARLAELQESGLVHRRTLPPPAGSAIYELTTAGRELEDAILVLGRWGGRRLGPPRASLAFRPGWALLAMQASFRPELAAGLTGVFELDLDGEAFHIAIADARVELRDGRAERADLSARTDTETFLSLGFGALSAAAAVERELVQLDGDPALLERLFEAFRFPAADPGPDESANRSGSDRM